MVVCPKCGRELSAAGAYCYWCGATLLPSPTEPAASTEFTPEHSDRILQIGQELSPRLGMPQFKTTRVMWAATYRRKFALPDQPAFYDDIVLLSDKVKGKLERKDWVALLAAGLVYDHRLRLRRRLFRLVILLGLVLAAVAASWIGLVVFSILYPPQSNESQHVSNAAGKVGGPVILFLILGGMYLVMAITAPYMRHLWFLADRMAAKELGVRDSLLMALKKIDDLGIEPSWVQRRHFSHYPSAGDRMQKLSRLRTS